MSFVVCDNRCPTCARGWAMPIRVPPISPASKTVNDFILIPYLYIHFTGTKVVETANRTKKNTKFFHLPGQANHQPPHFHINYQPQSHFPFIHQSH